MVEKSFSTTKSILNREDIIIKITRNGLIKKAFLQNFNNVYSTLLDDDNKDKQDSNKEMKNNKKGENKFSKLAYKNSIYNFVYKICKSFKNEIIEISALSNLLNKYAKGIGIEISPNIGNNIIINKMNELIIKFGKEYFNGEENVNNSPDEDNNNLKQTNDNNKSKYINKEILTFQNRLEEGRFTDTLLAKKRLQIKLDKAINKKNIIIRKYKKK